MNSQRLYYILVSLVSIAFVCLVGSGYGANLILENKSTALSKLKAESQAVDELQIALLKSKADVTKYSELNAIAESIVPQDKNQTETVREIVKIAEDNGISRLSSVTFPSSTLGNTATKSSNITQVLAVKGMSGVYTLPITVAVSDENAVTYEKLIAFLKGLEQNRRTAQVTTLTIVPSSKGSNIAFTVVINEYIKP